MTTGERGARIREVRQRLAEEGPPWTRPHERDFETVSMPERDCDPVRDLLIAEGVETVVEVGLAYGSSALAIGEALVALDPPDPQHVVVDPFQETAYSNVGWDLMRDAGLDSIAPPIKEVFTDQGQTHVEWRSKHVRSPLIDGEGGGARTGPGERGGAGGQGRASGGGARGAGGGGAMLSGVGGSGLSPSKRRL
ncbi:hypothetical protein [Micromonospora sp. CPCC 206061]|uniref:hypothetical protein n=1 Tax=Micromonospora sp. CPCC 206061 TaxID=3122410 RepID=UPI002FF39B41